MDLEIRVFANYRDAVGGPTLDWDAPDGATVGAVLHDLAAAYPDLDVLGDDGDIGEFVSVLHNGRNVVHGDGLETALADGDALSLFPPVAGG